MSQIWDPDEADRFVKLALNYPELLTFDEEKLWKLITELSLFWLGDHEEVVRGEIKEQNGAFPNIDLVRKNWETLKKINAGEATIADLWES